MNNQRFVGKIAKGIGVLAAVGTLLTGGCVQNALAQGDGSLSTVTEEAQIQPLLDGTEKFMLKSDGYYCLNADGTKDCNAGVHYLDHFSIDGTVFHGYYYHDESGKYKAEDSHLVFLPQSLLEQNEHTLGWKEGIYLVNNLGRISSVSRVEFLENTEVNQKQLNGYYYFDENGRLEEEGNIRYLDNVKVNDKLFDGYYSFRTDGGALSEKGVTAQGLAVDENGKAENLTEPGMNALEKSLKEMLKDYAGTWSVYVKNLDTQEDFSINNQVLSSASLIKAFAMAASYANWETVCQQEGSLLKADPASDAVGDKLYRLMENMVIYSDNESYNEMVRLQTASGSFQDGAKVMDRYLRDCGYQETAVLHTLAPSATDPVGIGSSNNTSVTDCGKLLESIYLGKCVDADASEKMLNFLLAQDNRKKIPSGLPEGILVANKTGENDASQHDMAIVFGEQTDYILCIMSENAGKEAEALSHIQSISAVTYYALNAG